MKKTIAILLAMLMIVGMIAGCSSDDDDEATDEPEETEEAAATEEPEETEEPAEEPEEDEEDDDTASDELTIGWSVYDTQQEFFQNMEEGVVDKADELGVELILHDQQNSEDEMVSGATRLIEENNVDALVISPCKPEAMGNIVELAKDKGIPVVICDIGDGDSDKDVIIVSDMYGGGEMAGEYCLQLLEEEGVEGTEYAVIRCEASAVYAARRPEGFKDVMDAAGYTMVAELTADSDQVLGYEAMQDILASNPEIVAVFCANDPMALGAMEACQEAGRDDIFIFGFNGDDGALVAIEEGTLHGTVAQDPAGIGALGVELAVELANGGSLTYDETETKEIFAEVTMIGRDGTVVS